MYKLTLPQIIEDLHAIYRELQRFEKTHQLLSDTFYKLYLSGRVEHTPEFAEWIGLIQLKDEREAEYEALLLYKEVPLSIISA